jgi:putative protease
MNQARPTPGLLSLPVLPSDTSELGEWNGLAPVHPLPDSPEPLDPQGAYGETPLAWLQTPEVVTVPTQPVELLAPAGGLDAAFAAFHFGADAVYLGLKKFSARAEAENFTLDEVSEITAYAHSLQPRRRLFVTVNTLIRQDELAELVEAVATLADIKVDALIIQDLGVYHLVRRHFPGLELHASTQLAVHNRAGAEVLHDLGFKRVVLARELTFEEVRDITTTAGIETEVFIHGALCYSYSGLCLFSSQTLGRSGNRGKCAYSCRDSYEVDNAPLTLRDGSQVRRDPRRGFPFSMKDLALPDHIPALRAAGVSCFKIEGRKKSPLYVATTTDYYRRLIDGRLSPDERPAREADMQTVFSRPWTRLFVHSHKDKEVADRDTVGHRGTPIGHVETVLAPGSAEARLRFRTKRTLERHDGLQIDLPILGKPFGFAVDRLWTVTPGRHGKRTEEFEAAAGSLVEVALPADHPEIPKGAPIYCSASQAVKQRYRHDRPKPGQYCVRKPLEIEIDLSAAELRVTGRVPGCDKSSEAITVVRCLPGPFSPVRDLAAMAEGARGAFAKLGQTRFELDSFTLQNDEGLFVPVSRLNQIRREITEELEEKLQHALAVRIGELQRLICPAPKKPTPTNRFRWSIKVDRVESLDALDDSDLQEVDEIVIDIARDHSALLEDSLSRWAARLGGNRIRLALPALTRSWEDKGIRHKIEHLGKSGWSKWEAANLSAWSYLREADLSALDLAVDWSVYVLNRLAAEQLLAMGVTRFALSPEDGLQNMRSLLGEYAKQAVVIVYQDTPQFLAESCAYANLIGGCPGKAICRFESMEMVSSHGERVTALDYHCRTIVLNQGAFCISDRLKDLAHAGAVNLRADFVYRKYDPMDLRDRWREVRAGKAVPGGLSANFDRGIL